MENTMRTLLTILAVAALAAAASAQPQPNNNPSSQESLALNKPKKLSKIPKKLGNNKENDILHTFTQHEESEKYVILKEVSDSFLKKSSNETGYKLTDVKSVNNLKLEEEFT